MSHEKSTVDVYEACLMTNEYGETYLDPEKCKARNFDPVRASQEQRERISSYLEGLQETSKEKRWRVSFKAFESMTLNPSRKSQEIRSLITKAAKHIRHKHNHNDDRGKDVGAKVNEVLLERRRKTEKVKEKRII
ncbi:uncharacterized protein OCT59_022241 [Rhizophagus irregularis]|uniref:Uncharacterized protein n=5 Tax=Rhizophagus irregularis TaxID=588596 RepID=A0A915ZG33_9GLOM|nr:hypothetical protein GLOIN_2v1487582 [Rhizophagus irregularis DAOM 181602=DAOM 197198]UZO28727.1 hypothetical protein OCT59_022241 [Rhizophagus irregularis]POG59746.1 hypothetical protein GLOIN_2v1487582 [Rhizophagus irregularis DAOM 181602=DAOM 197198]CAB4486119.1 unnamed protein product [Rhizophagus irregularis]CAB5210203.1 unnamed protein product [Rhizophagus irregularis]CAB5373253.1 unnamed protein product [Rhizophagus irregularis]|eukprot:XP_025166612.1 hypothetical protein GLOIN_2v1487582 [Rhizophagus irregularis DAOM 181602=DAOM 197198]